MPAHLTASPLPNQPPPNRCRRAQWQGSVSPPTTDGSGSAGRHLPPGSGTWSGGGQNWDTTFEVGLNNLLADGDTISIANNAPLANSTPALIASAQSPASKLGLAAPGG